MLQINYDRDVVTRFVGVQGGTACVRETVHVRFSSRGSRGERFQASLRVGDRV